MRYTAVMLYIEEKWISVAQSQPRKPAALCHKPTWPVDNSHFQTYEHLSIYHTATIPFSQRRILNLRLASLLLCHSYRIPTAKQISNRTLSTILLRSLGISHRRKLVDTNRHPYTRLDRQRKVPIFRIHTQTQPQRWPKQKLPSTFPNSSPWH